MSSNTAISVMDQIIERAVEQNPHAAELLKAFGPIVAKQRQLSNSITLPKMDYSVVDKEKLHAGVPVIKQIYLFSPTDPYNEMTLSLISAVKESMPKLRDDLNRLSNLISQGKLCLADCWAVNTNHENKSMSDWGKKLKVSPSSVSFIINLVSRVILEARTKEIAANLGEHDWGKGYCPICGDFPSIALIEETEGKRFLHCSSCGHDWRFTRVVCPYCENEAQSGMDYFYVENKTQESAFVCEKCRKYLITLNRAGTLFSRDMDISAISLIHLDMIMQDKGYAPMTLCAWNVFD